MIEEKIQYTLEALLKDMSDMKEEFPGCKLIIDTQDEFGKDFQDDKVALSVTFVYQVGQFSKNGDTPFYSHKSSFQVSRDDIDNMDITTDIACLKDIVEDCRENKFKECNENFKKHSKKV